MIAVATTMNAVNCSNPVCGASTHDHTALPCSFASADNCRYIQIEIKIMTGAAKSAKRSIDLIPSDTLNNCNVANTRKQINQLSKPTRMFRIPLIANAPKYVLIPNQHEAVNARANDGKCVPIVPNGARI